MILFTIIWQRAMDFHIFIFFSEKKARKKEQELLDEIPTTMSVFEERPIVTFQEMTTEDELE